VASESLGLGSEKKERNEEQNRRLSQLKQLWADLEKAMLNEGGKVRNMGLCDVETETLAELYKSALTKPSSITVRHNLLPLRKIYR
jgi:diketogulonate reductase-like aldo/keto reductase